MRVYCGRVPMASALALAVAGACVSGEALAADAASQFGAREDVRQISISPDGKNVAFISSREPRGEVLYIVPLAGGEPRSILTSAGGNEHLSRCSWVNDTRLICHFWVSSNAAAQLLTYTRMLAVDSNGSQLKVLFQEQSAFRQQGLRQSGGGLIDLNGGASGQVLVTRDYSPEMSTNTRLAETREGLGVDRLDSISLSRRPIEAPRRTAVEYISDGRGNVRVMGLQPPVARGYAGSLLEYMYRQPGKETWEPLSKVDFDGVTEHGFNPYAVDPVLNVAYGFDDKDGYQALYSIKLDGSMAREVVVAHPGADIDDLVRIGRDQRVVGVSYAGEYRKEEIFDPGLRTLLASLRKALPKDSALNIIDASADESKLLLRASGDVNPGMYYVFDKATHSLSELMPSRPQLADVALAPMKPVSFPAADGTMIPGYLTLPPGSDGRGLPAIVMPHGGPSSRDEWGFDWLVQYFAHQGYAVLQPNYRGSAGYGEAWFQNNGFQSWRTAIGDIDDAGRWLLSQGIAAKDKLAIVGWSYGGYAALQSGVTEPGLFKAIVAIAPVTDLEMVREDHRFLSDLRIVDKQIGTGPHVRDGSPAQNAGKLAVPVLMFHGDIDQNVNVGQARFMQKRMQDAGKPIEYVEFAGLDHQLDDTAARAKMLGASDAFLRKTLGLPAATSSVAASGH